MTTDGAERDDELSRLIKVALAEDVGEGDWTTLWTVPPSRVATGRIIAKAPGVIAGLDAALVTFHHVDPRLVVDVRVSDGQRVTAGDEILTLRGSAASILSGERLALNFLQRLSGVATVTRAFVDAVDGTQARILDTRKTTPGMRALEKRAVVAGGGMNHRFGLHDMVLIKENHIRAAGGVTAAIRAVAVQNRRGLAVEVEVTNLVELREALAAGVDRILLDNMSVDRMRESVRIVRADPSRPETEASGGVTLANVRAIAETGVDFVSVGAITHSAPALDLSLLLDHVR